MSFPELQTSDYRHREEDDDNVRCDVEGRVGEPHGELVDAACGLLSPESLYRYAGEDAAKYCPDGVADYYSKDAPARESELPRGKYAVVLQQDRNLRQSE